MPAEFCGPNREQLEAFVTRLRFFTLNKEPTSLKNVSELLGSDSTVPTKLIQQFEAVRKDLNKALDESPPIKMTSKNDPIPPTWREIMDVFIYGDLVHSDQATRYERWKSQEMAHVLFSYYLSRILSAMASGIVFIADLFDAELKGTAPPAKDANAP